MMTMYSFFCIRTEYRHYLQLRMHYLGHNHNNHNKMQNNTAATVDCASSCTSTKSCISYASHPQLTFSENNYQELGSPPPLISEITTSNQHQYSVLCRNIPLGLRSDLDLYNYFDALFPGKVFAARIVMNIPADLSRLIKLRDNVRDKLEKSMITRETKTKYYTSIGRNDKKDQYLNECRPHRRVSTSHMDKYQSREIAMQISCLLETRNETKLSNISCFQKDTYKVDCVAYYDLLLRKLNENVTMQQKNSIRIASNGEKHDKEHWQQAVSDIANSVFGLGLEPLKVSERHLTKDSNRNRRVSLSMHSNKHFHLDNADEKTFLLDTTVLETETTFDGRIHNSLRTNSLDCNDNSDADNFFNENREDEKLDDFFHYQDQYFNEQKKKRNLLLSAISRFMMALGFDFVISASTDCLNYGAVAREHLFSDYSTNGGMTSTGFVTFCDLTSVTCAVSAPLTSLPGVLTVSLAPEPRDIIWDNIRVDPKIRRAKINAADILFMLGAVLWSIPVATIQTLSTADNLYKVPGFGWMANLKGGFKFTVLINSYLPVTVLLVLIMLLPVIFEMVALRYERLKCLSNVQDSIFRRYFYYQLANIFVTTTAGSIWESMRYIVDKPEHMFEILGSTLPTMAGFFISLLITKTLAGLPMVLINAFPLLKILLMKVKWGKAVLQREMKAEFQKEDFDYGYIYSNLVLVLVICFTYACISPILLPFGAIFFLGSLLVYKRQALFIYVTKYESGGLMFPTVCSRTLVGLMLSQLVFFGYLFIRKANVEAMCLSPLPFLTYWVMGDLFESYAVPGMRLTLERAKDIDNLQQELICSSNKAKNLKHITRNGVNGGGKQYDVIKTFDADAYRQPALKDGPLAPLPTQRYHQAGFLVSGLDQFFNLPILPPI